MDDVKHQYRFYNDFKRPQKIGCLSKGQHLKIIIHTIKTNSDLLELDGNFRL